MTMNAALHSFAYGLDFLREQVADVKIRAGEREKRAADSNARLLKPVSAAGDVKSLLTGRGGQGFATRSSLAKSGAFCEDGCNRQR
jgi:hypothetical protein